jgi:hypothetical protein
MMQQTISSGQTRDPKPSIYNHSNIRTETNNPCVPTVHYDQQKFGQKLIKKKIKLSVNRLWKLTGCMPLSLTHFLHIKLKMAMAQCC